MFCPKCGAETSTDECVNCGVIISRYVSINEKEKKAGSGQRKKFEIYYGEKPSAKKALIINILFFLIVFIVYFTACPFLTIQKIKETLEQPDNTNLSEYIDYDTLRINIKKQYDKKIIDGMKMTGNNPLADLTATYVSKITDPMIEETLTPEGIKKLMTGYKKLKFNKSGKQMDDLSPADQKITSDLLLDARKRYDSFNSFSVLIINEDGQDTKIILTRSGIFSWKIDNIIMPE